VEIRVKDPHIAQEIADLVARDKLQASMARARRALSYDKRFALFVERHVLKDDLAMLGFKHWYKRVPLSCCFGWHAINEYFKKGEPEPCIMRGSKYHLRADIYAKEFVNFAQYRVPLGVIKRWMRRVKFTCVDADEWHEMRNSKAWREFYDRIVSKWGGDSSWSDYLGRSLSEMVTPVLPWRTSVSVILNGEEVDLTIKQYEAVKRFSDMAKKIENDSVGIKKAKKNAQFVRS
jgi:hypothetical protein